jgi:hypothetical protein
LRSGSAADGFESWVDTALRSLRAICVM